MASKKLLVFATVAWWPAEPGRPRAPVHRPQKTARPAVAASAAAPAVASAVVPAPVASAPESPMDRLQRRLAEKLGANGTLQAGAGELKLTSRRSSQPPGTP
jgi:hypothetical protein